MSAVVYGLIGGAIAYACEPLMKRYPRTTWIVIGALALLIASVVAIQLLGL